MQVEPGVDGAAGLSSQAAVVFAAFIAAGTRTSTASLLAVSVRFIPLSQSHDADVLAAQRDYTSGCDRRCERARADHVARLRHPKLRPGGRRAARLSVVLPPPCGAAAGERDPGLEPGGETQGRAAGAVGLGERHHPGEAAGAGPQAARAGAHAAGDRRTARGLDIVRVELPERIEQGRGSKRESGSRVEFSSSGRRR